MTGGSGTNLLVYANPGRVQDATPLVNTPITLPTQAFTVPVTVPVGKAWWRAELRGAGVPGLDDVENVKNLQGNPMAVPDPTDQPLAVCAPVFAYTDVPAVPVPADSPPPPTLATAVADDLAAPVTLGTAGTFTGFPALASAAGVSHLAAERHLPGETHVVYRRGNDPEQTLSTGTAARFPRVGRNRHRRLCRLGAGHRHAASAPQRHLPCAQHRRRENLRRTAAVDHRGERGPRHPAGCHRDVLGDARRRLAAERHGRGFRRLRPRRVLGDAGQPLRNRQDARRSLADGHQKRRVSGIAVPVGHRAPRGRGLRRLAG